MSEELTGAKILRDTIYSFETWELGIKILLIFIAVGLLIILVRSILKAIARFIRRITR